MITGVAKMTHTDFTSRRVVDIEPKMAAFLQEKVNTFIKWDLVRFFHDNPHAMDTAENVARYTGREPDAIQDDLRDLVGTGVLEKEEVAGRSLYRLASDNTMKEMISSFVRACDDRMFRVKAINYVIRAMR